jgi:hypothetical protein
VRSSARTRPRAHDGSPGVDVSRPPCRSLDFIKPLLIMRVPGYIAQQWRARLLRPRAQNGR